MITQLLVVFIVTASVLMPGLKTPMPGLKTRPATARGDWPATDASNNWTAQERSRTFAGRLKADGAVIRYPDGKPFAWRGLTSFRLLELVAAKRDAEVERYLAWAAQHDITIVRVLAMAKHLFELDPVKGRSALPRLLTAAREHGLYVEIVALADTDSYPINLDQHVRAVGEIAAQHDNAVVEIANEPDHQTQREELAEAHRLLAFARLVPEVVPVALGSGGDWQDPVYAVSKGRPNTYLTVHFPRSDEPHGWGPHVSLRSALRLQAAHNRFVVDDEPIGAGQVAKVGARDADPLRWFGHGLLARVLKIGSTFHSDAGLQATVPTGVELTCFEAWRRGMLYLPADLSEKATALDADETIPDNPAIAPVASFNRGAAVSVFTLADGTKGWIVAVGVSGDPAIKLRDGWRITSTERHQGVWVQTAER